MPSDLQDCLSMSAGSHGKKTPCRLQQCTAKGMGRSSARPYLSYVLCTAPVQYRTDDHATLRDSPMEEVLGQGRQHLEERAQEESLHSWGRGFQEPSPSAVLPWLILLGVLGLRHDRSWPRGFPSRLTVGPGFSKKISVGRSQECRVRGRTGV